MKPPLLLIIKILFVVASSLSCALAAEATTEAAPLRVVLRTEKQTYAAGETITVRFVVENVSNQPLILADDPLLLFLKIKDKSEGKNRIAPFFQAGASQFPRDKRLQPFELAPRSSYTKLINFGSWQIVIGEKGEHLGTVYNIREFPNRYELRGFYKCSEKQLASFSNHNEGINGDTLTGSSQSDPVIVEVIGKPTSVGTK